MTRYDKGSSKKKQFKDKDRSKRRQLQYRCRCRAIKDQTNEEKGNPSPTNGGISYPALYPNAGAFFYTKDMKTHRKKKRKRKNPKEV